MGLACTRRAILRLESGHLASSVLPVLPCAVLQKQGGRIGITLDCTFLFPLDPSSSSDKAAAQRGMEFQLPW